jgi:hypothetical protein
VSVASEDTFVVHDVQSSAVLLVFRVVEADCVGR